MILLATRGGQRISAEIMGDGSFDDWTCTDAQGNVLGFSAVGNRKATNNTLRAFFQSARDLNYDKQGFRLTVLGRRGAREHCNCNPDGEPIVATKRPPSKSKGPEQPAAQQGGDQRAERGGRSSKDWGKFLYELGKKLGGIGLKEARTLDELDELLRALAPGVRLGPTGEILAPPVSEGAEVPPAEELPEEEEAEEAELVPEEVEEPAEEEEPETIEAEPIEDAEQAKREERRARARARRAEAAALAALEQKKRDARNRKARERRAEVKRFEEAKRVARNAAARARRAALKALAIAEQKKRDAVNKRRRERRAELKAIEEAEAAKRARKRRAGKKAKK